MTSEQKDQVTRKIDELFDIKKLVQTVNDEKEKISPKDIDTIVDEYFVEKQETLFELYDEGDRELITGIFDMKKKSCKDLLHTNLSGQKDTGTERTYISPANMVGFLLSAVLIILMPFHVCLDEKNSTVPKNSVSAPENYVLNYDHGIVLPPLSSLIPPVMYFDKSTSQICMDYIIPSGYLVRGNQTLDVTLTCDGCNLTYSNGQNFHFDRNTEYKGNPFMFRYFYQLSSPFCGRCKMTLKYPKDKQPVSSVQEEEKVEFHFELTL